MEWVERRQRVDYRRSRAQEYLKAPNPTRNLVGRVHVNLAAL
jgi:hypothetical protein